jgi:hypothetical protein
MTSFELKNEVAGRIAESLVDAMAVDPSNGDHELGRSTRGLWVGSSGSLRVRMLSGAIVNFHGIASGTVLPIAVTAVLQEGTDANQLQAMF